MTALSRRSRRAGILLAVVAALVTPAILAAQYPTKPPPSLPLRPLQFPPFQEAKLNNGLQIVVVENHRLPVVSVSLNVPAGSRFDPADQTGLASMTAELITKGTSKRSAEQIAEAIEYVGASLNAGAGNDFFSIGTTVLTEHVQLAFDLISDVLLHATYPEDELELARKRELSGIRLNRSDPGFLASEFFSKTVYGDEHPYGQDETEASVNAITPASVRTFAETHLKPQGSILVLAGDITQQDARRLAQQFLGQWGGTAPTAKFPTPPAARPTRILLVHRPGSAQSNIRVGNLALRPGADVYYAATVANKILGGGTDARLFMILREQKSWTYGAYSNISRPLDIGMFQANTEVRTSVTDSALVELLHQLTRIRTETAADSELAAAKGFLVGSFPLTIQTPQQIAGQVANVKLLGLGEQYLRTYRERLAAVTSAQVQRAAQRVINRDSLAITVVGDGQAIYDKLTPIAPVDIVDPDGKSLTPDDLAPKATAITYDLAGIAMGRDSFQVLAQGNPLGTMVTEVTKEGNQLVYHETLAIPMAGVQSTSTVHANASTLAPLTSESQATQGGQSGGAKLTYDGLHVTGSATVPQPGGTPKTIQIDTTVAAGTVDGEMTHLVTMALPLAEGASFTINSFESSQASVRTTTIKVAGVEDVTVPAGTFSAYRLNVTSGAQALTYYVTKASPRRVVKIALAAQPIEFVLVH